METKFGGKESGIELKSKPGAVKSWNIDPNQFANMFEYEYSADKKTIFVSVRDNFTLVESVASSHISDNITSINTVHGIQQGTGNGLDADLLDGEHASAFADAVHTHDDRYFTETEANARFLLETNNLSDLTNDATARTNLGLGTAAVEDAATAATGNTVVKRDADGDIVGRYVEGSYLNMSHAASDRNSDTVFYSSTDNYIRKTTAAGMRAALGLSSAVSYLLHIEDQKPSGTNGGAFTAGAWRTRVLTTVVTNEITGASLASNQITLPAGTYEVEWSCPGYHVSRHQTRIYDTVAGSTLLSGSSEFSDTTQTISIGLGGRIILATESVIELQHRCQTSIATRGLGVSSGTSFAVDHETYSVIKIRKLD